MLKSGKELKVFTISEEHLEQFATQAKRYGVVYCALRGKEPSPDGMVDVMVRAEDASKINRIVERFNLAKWKKEQLRMKLLQGDRWVDSGYIFTQDDGSRMHPDSITDWLNKFSKDHNLPHIHPHAFRHTVASIMIANGVDLVTTANELGHANATTTATIYAHQIAIAQAKAANVRAGIFTNKDAKPSRKRA